MSGAARMPDHSATRRSFFGLSAGGAALLCSLGGQQVRLDDPDAARKADALASQVPRPPGATAGHPVDALVFGTPEPQPGGVKREYWIQAKVRRWDVVPTQRDDWHNEPVSGRRRFQALVYQLMTPGFAGPAGPSEIPGPTLHAEVGDTLVVHFRNNARELEQALTLHPHGVRYTPDYDGVYLGEHTRIGGWIAPGEEFSYTWEATPDSVGVWPYHDHGPNHTLNTFRGAFGAIIVRPKGEKPPDAEHVLFLHQLLPTVTRLPRAFQAINGRAYAGNTPTIETAVGQDVAIHVMGMDDNFHDFHIHGHRWK
ncbi:MAG TPA: multicopper oxidase domain-containing protein, partial [Solirubrobacteraceae bacterium]|nr:multicopper oxidase domain-containing protein [Solirubrobacteraceae bacterium]